MNIDVNKLNTLEHQINETIIKCSKENLNLKIAQAAEACGCSMSKISKFVKKLGFNNYKQYMNFLYGHEISQKYSSNELERIKDFLDDFDLSLVDEFIDLMNSCDKIILFGYGPSFICTQYFEYKLRLTTNKFISSAPDEISVERLIDDKSLLVIFSATGKFKSFEKIYNYSKSHNCKVLLIVEEYNTSLLSNYDNVLMLTKSTQSNNFKPYEKSRTIFFIFIEEVIQHIILKNRQKNVEQKQMNTTKEDI
ncbi:MurR/RpiR family transcriptional regulator [Clostridium psychrophilum]|uniref:MurR/RpiR family transcriptional regulator n=1 Tax=Clostridium psychrophilum TaxID=132926 RepID=UPI001FEA453D|nr:SIS domain-containing protein [Clostridium psychrophilum]